MKIALITIHQANNYGAVLQAYATKKVLSRYGQVSTIDYDNRFLSHHLDLFRVAFSVKGLKMLIHDILRFPYRYKAVSKFRNFVKDNMNLTEKLTSKELAEGKANDFDLYMCGSDQIWNPKIVNPDIKIDPIFFLSFAPIESKKISYASSVGSYIFSETEKNQVRNLLKNFTMISTREIDGQKQLSEILPNKEIYHVLDPTLLLSKNEWVENLDIKITDQSYEKYILLYTVPRTSLIAKAVEYFATKLELKVIAIDQMFFPITKVDEHIKNAGPREFIELFANAEFIITDSFHGTCFAINFEKQFVSISPGKSANRINSLLSKLDIKERIVYDESEFDKLPLDFDYSNVSRKLSSIREKSLYFIRQSTDT